MSAWSIPALAALLALLLLVAAWGDLRTRTIPNGLNAMIALLAPLWWWAHALPLWPDVAIQIGAALLVFAIFAAAFAAGLMGGGDVKMVAALSLWLAPFAIAQMLVVMALAGGVLTIVVAAEHRLRRRDGQPEVPYGMAIAFAGLWLIANDILTSIGH
ncbi:A24 family peptidase [Sphingomonas solaris]|uniref:Peptidase n=1 Tax=Alterirhizorhabdus solaris TaxID=2529389 RepID=A0A558QZ43_9SPHN|nr:prepilin peptidase [Sphingomonas solaris]TVV72368.1 peptidase [Sphingomonas solaris]